MAARRRSSARRSSSPGNGGGAAPAGRSSPTRSRAARSAPDGKATIHCPQCGQQYRIAETAMEQQVKCKHCHRAFFPIAASRRAPSTKTNATPFIMGGAVLAFAIVIGFFVSRPPSTPVQAGKKSDAAESRVDTDDENPRVRGILAWIEAIHKRDSFNATLHSDLDAIGVQLGMSERPRVDDAAQRALFERLFDGEEGRYFRDFRATSGSVAEDEADAATGTASIYLSVRPEAEARYFDRTMELAVDFRYVDLRGKVRGWKVVRKPREFVKKGKTHKVHEAIGAPEIVEREFGGETIQVEEAELVALPHFPGTPVETQRKIDEAISQIVDLEAPGGQFFHATETLRDIGKPSVPRLLNKMYETGLDTRDNVLRLRRVCQALSVISGQRFGFNPAVTNAKDIGADEATRISVLKQWYGWWAHAHDRDDWDIAIDKEPGDPDKAPESGAIKK